MKSFFSNFHKQPPSANNVPDASSSSRYADVTQAKGFSNKASSSSLLSSSSFWNDPTRGKMPDNDEITLENDRILPSFSTQGIPSSTNKQEARLSNHSNDFLFDDIKTNQRPNYPETDFSNQKKNIQRSDGENNKSSAATKDNKNDDEEKSSGVVLLKTRIISDDVPARDYGAAAKKTASEATTPSSTTNLLDRVISTFTPTTPSQSQVSDKKPSRLHGLLPVSKKSNTQVENGGLRGNSVLDMVISEANEYVESLNGEAANVKAPAPPVPSTSKPLASSASDIKLDISMFEKGKLPKVKKKSSVSDLEKRSVMNKRSDSDRSATLKPPSNGIAVQTAIKEAATSNSDMYDSIADSKNKSNVGNQENMSQYFKIGLPTFVQNKFQSEDKESKPQATASNNKKNNKKNNSTTKSPLTINTLNDLPDINNGLKSKRIVQSSIHHEQQEISEPNNTRKESSTVTFERSEEEKDSTSNNEERVKKALNSKTRINGIQKSGNAESAVERNKLSQSNGVYKSSSDASSSVARETLRASKPIVIPALFTSKKQGGEQLQLKPMVHIPKNDFVKNKMFKKQLEKVIANPVMPGKKSKSMSSLNEKEGEGKSKKFKFLVEGIDIPARSAKDEVDHENRTKKEPKGFAYIKGKLLAAEVTKRANEVASRKPHEYVEHYSIEREILSAHEENEVLLKAREELHAHVKSLKNSNSVREELSDGYERIGYANNESNTKERNESEESNLYQNDYANENMPKKDNRKNERVHSESALCRKTKSDFDLSRISEDDDFSSFSGPNHSIPHDTSRVFLKPHDQDHETLRRLKDERHRYLRKKTPSREGIDGNALHNPRDLYNNNDSPIYTKSQNSSNGTTLSKKNKIKGRSKQRQNTAHKTHVGSRVHAADEKQPDDNTGDEVAYTAFVSKQSHQLLINDNKDDRGKARDRVDGRFFVDASVENDFNNINKYPKEFEDLGKFVYNRGEGRRGLKNLSKSNDHQGKHRTAAQKTSEKVIAGFISFANTSRSLDDIYGEISAKLSVQKKKVRNGTKKNFKKPSKTGVQIYGPSVFYDPFYNQAKFRSLPNFNKLDNLDRGRQPSNIPTLQDQHTDLQRAMHNESSALRSNVIWEEPISADPELESVDRKGNLYRVQVRLNNTPMGSRVASSLSNKNHLLSNHFLDFNVPRNTFKSANYIKNNLPTPHLPPTELSSHSTHNHSISPYLQALSTVPQREIIRSDLRSVRTEEDRFAVKSIKSTEAAAKEATPNKIEFDLELLQSVQPVSNNVNYVSSHNHPVRPASEETRHVFGAQQDYGGNASRPRSRKINASKSEQSLLLVNDQYRDDDVYISDLPNLVKGSVLIDNSLNQNRGGHLNLQEDSNLFGGHYYQAKENPIYASDMEASEARSSRKIIASPNAPSIAVEWEETGGYQKQLPINKKWYHDYVFAKNSKQEFSSTPSGPWKLRSSQNRGANMFSRNASDYSETEHIRQSVDVKKEEEELIGPLRGESRNEAESALNIDAISEKVELSLLNGMISIQVRVRCERLVPIRGTEDMFKKSAVVVTRMIDIDMSVSPQRQAMYRTAVALSRKDDSGRGSDKFLRLGTKDTFELYCKLMEMADAADGNQEGLMFGSVHIDKELEEERRLPHASMFPEPPFNQSSPTNHRKNRTRFL